MNEQDRREVIEQLGGVEKIREGLERFKANIDSFRHNHASLMEEYLNKWVAIQDEGVVATSGSLKGLMTILRRAGVDTGTCYIQFLDPNPKPQILTVQQARETLAFFLRFNLWHSCNFVISPQSHYKNQPFNLW